MKHRDQKITRGVGALVAAGVLVGVLQGAAGVGVADAKPGSTGSGSTNSNSNRGPNKATPQKTTRGSSRDSGRGPNKTRPGDTAFNDDHPRVGAEPDRGAHKVRPGDTWSPEAPRDRSRQPAPPRRPDPVQRPDPAAPTQAAPQTEAPQAPPPPTEPAAPNPQVEVPQPSPSQPTPAAPPTPRPDDTLHSTTLGSVTSPQGLPSTVAISDDPQAPTDYTVRYSPGSAEGPAPRVDFSPPGNHTSSWGNDPAVGAYGSDYKVGPGKVQLPVGTEADKVAPSGPRKLKGADVTAQVQTQVRISSATPVGQRRVRDSAGNAWTETKYRFDYQSRTMRNGGWGSIQATVPGDWSDISPGQAKDLFDRGIPRPRALGK